jgi:hypothetical protein
MDEGTEGFEKEVGEIKTSKIEVKDMRGEKADALQEREFKAKLEGDKVEEKLTQFETFLGSYTKQKVTEGLKVNLVDGRFGSGEVVNGILSVNLPSSSEILAVENDNNSKQFLDVLTKAGTTYKEIAMISASSTTLHESEHMIIDSRPGSKLDEDFQRVTGINNDESGHTLSFLDEGIVYAFQLEKDSENDLIQRLEDEKPQIDENLTVVVRKQLGEILRSKVKEYVEGGKQIDEDFLKFAGEEMKKLDIEKYVMEAEDERMMKQNRAKLEKNLAEEKGIIEKWNNFESREFENPTEILEKLVIEGYCFHGSSRKIDGDLEPQKATDLIKESGNENAVYLTINPLLAEFAGLYGGAEGITNRENICHMEINDGKVSYPGESYFAVNDPDKGAREGYVYVFDRKTLGFEEINGEILSKRKSEPLMVIKIKREDFKPEVKKIN